MPAPPTEIYEFGDFQIDLRQRQLSRRDGTGVPLTNRVFETLRYLVESGGKLLGKEVLMKAVWPDCVVEENNLTQNISTLRRAFGDSPGAQRYIVTVPGHGYRFVAEVRRVEGPDEAPTVALTPAIEPVDPPVQVELPASPPARRWAPYFAGLLATLLLVAVSFFWWRNSKSTAIPNESFAAVPQKSIAVLPFDNLSDDKENAYFVTGVQDEILSHLARIADLKVTSRTSANLYKSGNPRNLREIGQQLGVAHLLEGSVQRAGNHLRVHAQLVDARNDAHVWAQTYDRELADVFAIQSEIASAIASSLQAKLAPQEKTRLASKPTENTEAYLLYLQANELIRVARKKAEAVDADKLYAQAIALDPHFALAVARASMLNSLMYHIGRDAERKERARVLAEEALRLAPELGEAHLALGFCFYRIDRDYDAALKEFAIAGAASPNDSEILDASGFIARRQGRWRDALGMFERAQNLDPRRPHFDGLPDTLRVLRQWALAAEAYNHVLQLEPNLPDGWIGLAYIQFAESGDASIASKTLTRLPEAHKNKSDAMAAKWDYAMLARDFALAERISFDAPVDEFVAFGPVAFYRACVAFACGDSAQARVLLEETLPLYEGGARDHPDDPKFVASLARVYGLLGRKEEAIRTAQRAVELCPETKDAAAAPVYATNLAFVYAQCGEVDQAVTLLSHLLTTPAAERITLAHLRASWEWDALRQDPRFQKILEGPEPKTIY